MTVGRFIAKIYVETDRIARRFHVDRRAGMTMFIAVLFPAMIAMGLLAVDAVRAYSQAMLVRNATQLAAMAGAGVLRNYYTQGAAQGTSTIQTEAAAIGNASSSSSVDLSDRYNCNITNDLTHCDLITLGNWDTTTLTFTSLATSGTTNPNAVQAIGQATVATFFGGIFGVPTLPITKSASAATYASTKPINIIVLNDMGGPNINQGLNGYAFNKDARPQSPQQGWWAAQQAADLAIVQCIQNSGNPTSQLGFTGFVDKSYILKPLTTVNNGTGAAAIIDTINDRSDAVFQFCRQTKAAVLCHGTNVAAALQSAIAQFKDPAYAGGNNHIVIITNELPLYDATAAQAHVDWHYSLGMGTGVIVGPGVGPDGTTLAGTGTSPTALCDSQASPALCTSTNLKQMAEGQAAAAGQAGITISTIYFSGDVATPPGQATAYAREIASWTANQGVPLVTPLLTDVVVNGTKFPGVSSQASNLCNMLTGGSALRTASY